eukprot:Skav223113  [mRNA]  locus=scaffold419:767759:771759:+ [translate_table: standard]
MAGFVLLAWGLSPVQAEHEREGVGAAELEKRFEQLKALANAEGKADDPEFLQTMEDLKKQLQGLKEGQEHLKKSKEEADRLGRFAMATEVLGGSLSKEAFAFVERAADDNLTREEAAELPLFRMVSVCLGKRLAEGESDRAKEMLKHVTAGMKKGDEVKQQVRRLSPWAWNLLKLQASGAVYQSKWYNRGPPAFFLVFASPVPLYYGFQWLRRNSWLLMNRDEQIEKDYT